MTPTPDEVAALAKRLRNVEPDDCSNDIHCTEAADMLEALSRAGCPLGEDCDLTVAWMAGASRARDEGWNAAIEAAAKVARSCTYHDSAGSGFDEDAFDEYIRALRRPEGEKP